jgi:hypothetical protein
MLAPIVSELRTPQGHLASTFREINMTSSTLEAHGGAVQLRLPFADTPQPGDRRGLTAYEQYLLSLHWAFKRALVIDRAKGLCEGCGQAVATEVHHVTYPRGCTPGSAEWRRQEKLFHLRALCANCHRDLHHAAARSP